MLFFLRSTRQILRLLSPGQRRSAAGLLLLIVSGMALETLSIGLVVPAIALMTQEDILSDWPSVNEWLSAFGDFDHKQLLIVGMLVLVAVYAVKELFLGFLVWRQSRFIFNVQVDLSRRLFVGYLRQPWPFHLERNSALLVRNVISECGYIATGGLVPALSLITESLVTAGLAVVLFLVEPVGAILVLGILGIASWAFYRLTRARTRRWGTARQYHERFRVQQLQEGLGGAKEVKLLGREAEFVRRFDHHSRRSARMSQRQNAVQQFPRLWLEFLAVLGLATLVIVMIVQGKQIEALLPTLGLFIAAAFRLMPSANRILSSVQGLRFVGPVLDNIDREMANLQREVHVDRPVAPLKFEQAIALEDVSFRYPLAETAALANVTLTIERGTSVGLVGPSGAGKSTLVDVVLGLLVPTGGYVKVDGADIHASLRAWQNQVGYVPQTLFLTDDTLARNVAFGIADEDIDMVAVERAIRAAQLEDFVKSLPKGLETTVGERGVRLSGGQRQRIGIARALYANPALLVLDEATSSLDIETERAVMETVNSLHGNKTLLIVAHRPSAVAHCDRLYRIDGGQISDEGEPARERRMGASGPIPTFASRWTKAPGKCRNQKDH